ncbi:MAG: B12-binding domain-containing radical SAM protein [Desulfobacter sp.]|nr:MAG: B12-binding domain-containing radical SAM protein [Desulfobacter sp.]
MNMLSYNFETSQRVLLINPQAFPGQRPEKNMAFFPFSIVYIVNYLKRIKLCEIDYFDLVMEDESLLVEELQSSSYDLIGVTCLAANRFMAIDLIKKLRQVSPGSKIVVGGVFFGFFPEETLARVPEVDFVISGDGEYTMAELVRAMDVNQPYHGIKGLSFRDQEQICLNEKRPVEMHFERFYVELDLVRKPGYDILQPMPNLEWRDDIRAFPLLVSKGCVNRCVYCMNQSEVFRGMSLEFLMERIIELKEKYHTKYFLFTDPSFGSRPAFVRKLCQELIDRDIDIEWYCETRPDIDLDLLSLMRRAGCISIHFAIETGSPKIMKLMRRKTSLAQVTSFAKKCNRLGIAYGYFTLISFPGETLKEAWETLRVIEQLAYHKGFSGLSPLFIMPKTELENMAHQRGVLSEAFDWFDDDFKVDLCYVESPVLKTMPPYIEHLTEKQIYKIIRFSWALQDFIHGNKRVRHLRWRFITRTYFFVLREFWNAFSCVSEPGKKLDVLRMGVKVLLWFLIWKIKKPFIDFKERRR